jgi:hypothetical protein
MMPVTIMEAMYESFVDKIDNGLLEDKRKSAPSTTVATAFARKHVPSSDDKKENTTVPTPSGSEKKSIKKAKSTPVMQSSTTPKSIPINSSTKTAVQFNVSHVRKSVPADSTENNAKKRKIDDSLPTSPTPVPIVTDSFNPSQLPVFDTADTPDTPTFKAPETHKKESSADVMEVDMSFDYTPAKPASNDSSTTATTMPIKETQSAAEGKVEQSLFKVLRKRDSFSKTHVWTDLDSLSKYIYTYLLLLVSLERSCHLMQTWIKKVEEISKSSQRRYLKNSFPMNLMNGKLQLSRELTLREFQRSSRQSLESTWRINCLSSLEGMWRLLFRVA